MIKYYRIGYSGETDIKLDESNSQLIAIDTTPWWLRK